MKDTRPGEGLWDEWVGQWYDSDSECVPYFTEGHVALSEDVVRRALASTLQRDGLADSLGDGFKLIEGGKEKHLWAGYLPDDFDMSICDEGGLTESGDEVSVAVAVTFVDVEII